MVEEEFNIKAVYKDTIERIRFSPVGLKTYIFVYDLDCWKQDYIYQRCYFIMPKNETNTL